VIRKLCPTCIQVIQTDQVNCPQCGTPLRLLNSTPVAAATPTPAATPAAAATPVIMESSEKYVCGKCGSVFTSINFSFCRMCGTPRADAVVGISGTTSTGGQVRGGYNALSSVQNRASEIKQSAYLAMDIYIKLLTIFGYIFTGISVLLFFSMCLALVASTSDGIGQLLGMGGAFVTFPIILVCGLTAFSCFFARDALKMRMDDSKNLVIIAQCLNETAQQQAVIARILETRK